MCPLILVLIERKTPMRMRRLDVCSKQNKTMHGQSPTTSARLMRFVRMYDAQPKMVPGAHDQIALNRTEPN